MKKYLNGVLKQGSDQACKTVLCKYSEVMGWSVRTVSRVTAQRSLT